MSIETHKMLTVSTANVSEATMKRIAEWATMESEYGALISVHSHTLADSVPSDLRTLAIAAQGHECDYLMLDRDAEPYPGVPVYDW